jgi:hypothetical protein
MSASPDWVRLEAAISALLPELAGGAGRRQLLALLDDYSTAAIREARTLGVIVPSSDEYMHASGWLLHPVFICGHQRTGTTLLQSLLDGHPQLLTLPSEGTYFTSFAYVACAAPSSEALDRFAAEWIRRFIDPNFAPHFRLGMSDAKRNPTVDFARALFGWHASLRGRVPPRFSALLALAAAFRATTAPTLTPSLWVEKTPQNERYVGRLALLEGARFIQLVRDPRATFASLKTLYRTHGIGPFDRAEHAHAIGHALRLAVENRNRFDRRYLVVRYEDLVGRTEREVGRIAEFLGIAPHSTLLLPTAGGTAVRANTAFASSTAGKIETPRQAESLSGEDVAALGAYAAAAARSFGYSVPVPARAAGIALRARHTPRHVLRSARAALRALMRF